MDMPFFDAMLAQMSADYCVDPERISSPVRATAADDQSRRLPPRRRRPRDRCVAGSGPNNTSQCKGPVAAWIAHGMDDETVPFTSGRTAAISGS